MLPFPPYYPKTIPASAGIFASISGMIEIFKSEELGIIILVNQEGSFPLKNGLGLWFDYIG
ncbi:hypothetical protein [Candidatus Rickettsia kedanie]|uniref:Uncharacterized protein n=1 Tax=Candidatus Rickettsia kedanie TaxID=3115352 RepID=A0ABP9TRR5_9RICK